MAIKLNQIILYFLLHLFIKYCIGIKVIDFENIKKVENSPILLISNHPSRYDTLFLTALPLKYYLRLLPMNVLTAQKYYDNFIIKILIKPIGAYPIRKWTLSLKDALSSTVDKLNNNQNVMYFPEGRIAFNKIDKLRLGFSQILKETNSIYILPIKYEGIDSKSVFKMIFRNKIELKIRKMIKYENKYIIDYENKANLFYEKIYNS